MDFGVIANLGVAAFAIYIMWRMFDSNAQERKLHFDAFRALEADIRNKFATQLMENTNAMLEHSKIMQSVVKLLERLREDESR